MSLLRTMVDWISSSTNPLEILSKNQCFIYSTLLFNTLAKHGKASSKSYGFCYCSIKVNKTNLLSDIFVLTFISTTKIRIHV